MDRDRRASGVVNVQIGTMPTGQGHQTAFSQMVAEVLQAPYETIEIKYGDTDYLKDGGAPFGVVCAWARLCSQRPAGRSSPEPVGSQRMFSRLRTSI